MIARGTNHGLRVEFVTYCSSFLKLPMNPDTLLSRYDRVDRSMYHDTVAQQCCKCTSRPSNLSVSAQSPGRPPTCSPPLYPHSISALRTKAPIMPSHPAQSNKRQNSENMTHPQQITRKPLPNPFSIAPKPPPSRTTSNPITAYEIRSWIDSIPTPFLESDFPTTHPIYADTDCRLVVQKIVYDEAGNPSRHI